MATTEQFSLRWNNFHSNLTSGFHELLEAADMVDVTLAVDGHFLQAHKIVLSICSPFFKQMFKVNPCKHPIVILKDVGHEHMKDILEFMYMGQVSVLRENLTQFLRTAELLQVKGLTGDDSGDDTSSTKDVKSVCDNEDESDIYNHLIEAGMELPLYQPNTQPNVHQSGKRVKNINCSTNTKRAKCDYPQSKPSPAKEEFEPLKSKDYSHIQNSETPNINNSFNTTTASPESEAKEPLNMKVTWFGSESSIGDQSLGEQGGQTREAQRIVSMDRSTYVPTNNISSQYSASWLIKNRIGVWVVHVPKDSLQNCADIKTHVFCPYCYRKFVNRYNLKVHVRDKHETKVTDLDCQICGKTMRNQSCLRVHMYHHRKQQLDLEGLTAGGIPATVPSEVS